MLFVVCFALSVLVYLLFVASCCLLFVVDPSFVVFNLLRVYSSLSCVVVVARVLLLVVWRCVSFVVCGLLFLVSNLSLCVVRC